MKYPKVSIITPSCNSGKFINKTILSVKNQDYPNIEHAIIDGGSTDGTLDIIKSFEGTYNIRWVSEKDEGQYDAINKGFRMAKGDILGYINSDDMYLPDTISKVVNCFDAYKDVEVVYGDWHIIDEEGSIMKERRARVRPFDLRWLRCYDYINPSAAFIRSSIIKEGLFIDNSISHYGDWEWYLRIATAGKKFYFLNEKLCYFRRHPHSKIATLSKEESRKQRLMISKRYNIPLQKIEFWDNFLLPWRGRLFCLHYSMRHHNWPEIFRRSKKVLLRYLGIIITLH